MVKPLVFQSDFGYGDGAVSAMYGVAYSVCENIKVFNVTHDIPQYNIWEASYRLLACRNRVCICGRPGGRLYPA